MSTIADRRSLPTRLARASLVALLALAGPALSGCAAVGIASVMARSWEETGESTIPADYTGLNGKSFAVVIAADREVQGAFPKMTTRLTNSITGVIASQSDLTGATGFVPGPRVLQHLYNNPNWRAWSHTRLGDEFGVDRLIYVDIYEYRLYEPGNKYYWDGKIAARVGVVELDGDTPYGFTYLKDVQVHFPDGTGYTESDMPLNGVRANLEKRLVDRVSWLFFEHVEPNNIKY